MGLGVHIYDATPSALLLLTVHPTSSPAMSSRQPSQYYDPRREDREGRPTLPPIRDIFGGTLHAVWRTGTPADLSCADELSRAVPSSQTSSRRPSSSSSPLSALQRLDLADDAAPRSQTPAATRGPTASARTHGAYPDSARPASPATHARPPSAAGYRPILPQGHAPQYPPYARGTSIRHIDPNALATSGYPYAVSQPLAPYPPGAAHAGAAGYDPAGADRAAALANGRYECSWCGKGFTRPSSLKVRTGRDWHDGTL